MYLAIVDGVPEYDEGTIDRPVASEYRDGRRDATWGTELLDARTHYRLVEPLGSRAALLELILDTGRQHQIRIHLASIGHPVMGDRVYGPKGDSARPGDRPLLHAWRLAFPHPLTGQHISVEARPPHDFRKAIKRLSYRARG
jgi:23S rRNA pseudouridine1911/1915/1917 synthase